MSEQPDKEINSLVEEPADHDLTIIERDEIIAAQAAEIARLTVERDADVVRMERATAEIARLTAFERVLSAAHDAALEDAKRMRELLVETVAPLEVMRAVHAETPYTEMTDKLMRQIIEQTNRVRTAITPKENADGI